MAALIMFMDQDIQEEALVLWNGKNKFALVPVGWEYACEWHLPGGVKQTSLDMDLVIPMAGVVLQELTLEMHVDYNQAAKVAWDMMRRFRE